MGVIVEPVGNDEISPKLDQLKSCSRIALAVSGGPDSLALLHLVSSWISKIAGKVPELTVLTVDHGLREKSSEEADFVKSQSKKYGYRHVTLVWHGPKPVSGLQEAARNARYHLLVNYCKRHGITALLTGHHLDDQAETFLMRLARGSGIDGLASIEFNSSRSGIEIIRPLLGFPKNRLIETLIRQGMEWIDDPSNIDSRFERVQWRNKLPALAKLGLESEVIYRSASRLARARKALDDQTDCFARNLVKVHPIGFAKIDRQAYLCLPDEFALRVLGRVISAIGGGPRLPQLSKLEETFECLRQSNHKNTCLTLGRCQIETDGNLLRIHREVRSTDNLELIINPGENALWDQRYLIEVSECVPVSVKVRHLTEKQFLDLEIPDKLKSGVPLRSRDSLISIWTKDGLQAVPQIDYYSSASNFDQNKTDYRVQFNNFDQIFGTSRDNACV